MNYAQKIDKIVVKIHSKDNITGSGIIFLPDQKSENAYVITAKHCIFGDKYDNHAIYSDIKIIQIDENKEKIYFLKATDTILQLNDKTIDIVVLSISKNNLEEIFGQIPIINLSPLDTKEEACFFKGYPSATKRKNSRTIDDCKINHLDSNTSDIHISTQSLLADGIQQHTLDAMKGYSGSGICVNSENEIYLLGIVSKFEDWNNRFVGVKIHFLKELIPNLKFETPQNALYKTDIQKASQSLSKIPNYFGDNRDSHIKRDETEDLLNWIKQDLPEEQKNIAILVGDGGLGKTIVLRDLYDLLILNNIPTLAIKADQNTASDRVELEQKLFQRADVSIENIFNSLTQNSVKTVVIIDQLDALSLSLSSQRNFLTTYNRLIQDLSENPNIRLVLSIRKYDLEYDAALSRYKKGYHKIEIKPLNKEVVKKILTLNEIFNHSDKLVELLRIPNNLNVFCKIGDKGKVNIDTISSLKDLYDALWTDVVTTIKNKEGIDLKPLLYAIAKKMNDYQNIAIINSFKDEYAQELKILQSQTILVGDDKQLSFFHQSFYDYTFSRQFVDNKQILPVFILEKEQSLYVRAVIKMVLEYLREEDLPKFLETTKELLLEEKYRFHIKSLVLTTFGLTTNPTPKEETFVANHILIDQKSLEIFIGAISSDKWFSFIVKKNIIHEYLTKPTSTITEKEINQNLIFNLFRKNIGQNSSKVVDCLMNLPDFLEKDKLIEDTITSLNNWEDARLLPFFKKYFYSSDINRRQQNFLFYHLLEKIVLHHKAYALDIFKTSLLSIFENDSSYNVLFEYDELEFLKKLNELYPQDTFTLLFSLMQTTVDAHPRKSKEFESPLYEGERFSGNGFRYNYQREADVEIFVFLENYIKTIACNDHINFEAFYNTHKNSNSMPVLKLLFTGLTHIPTNSIYFLELIEIVHAKNGFKGYDNPFSLYLRNMIIANFPHLTSTGKERIIEIILELKSIGDFCVNNKDGKKRVYRGDFRKKQYMYIKELPQAEINNHPLLKKRCQELQRKFGIIEDKLLFESTIQISGIHTPLPITAYKKLDVTDWKKSMLKYGEDYIREHGSSLGGLNEHSRQFGEEVKNDVERYKIFVEDIITDKSVSIQYRFEGLSGLINGNYEPLEVLRLFKIFTSDNLNKDYTLYAIWKIEYFIANKIVDQEIIEFLVNLALNHENPTQPLNDAFSDSINTVRGAAIDRLIQCHYNPLFKDIIFDTVEQASNDPQSAVKVSILRRLAYLNNLDINKAFLIFLKLVDTTDEQVLEHSIGSAGYFVQKYDKQMIPYLTKLVEMDKFHEFVGKLIFYIWFNDCYESKTLFTKFIEKKEGKLAILYQVERHLINGQSVDARCLSILEKFLVETDEEFAHFYSTLILRKFKIEHFDAIYSYLSKYAKSILCLLHQEYFLKYLITCSKQYPERCLDLFEKINFDNTPKVQFSRLNGKDPLLVILAIYSALNAVEVKDTFLIDKSLDIFDGMLKSDFFRIYANEALDTL
jgi:hypothetical protein